MEEPYLLVYQFSIMNEITRENQEEKEILIHLKSSAGSTE
jgi:hypothetical protein